MGSGQSGLAHRLETVSKLIALRKSLDLYHQEGFFTRLTQLGLLKPSSRIQWFLPDGTTPMEHDWFDLGQRSFVMQLLDASETDVLIVINGVPEDKQFRLPSDNAWTPAWCSAESTGHLPGHGRKVMDIHLEGQQSTWTHSVPEDSEIHDLVERMQAEPSTMKRRNDLTTAFDADMRAVAKAEADAAAAALAAAQESAKNSENVTDTADGAGDTTAGVAGTDEAAGTEAASTESPTQPLPDQEPAQESADESAPDENVWTFPALSISLMKQLSY